MKLSEKYAGRMFALVQKGPKTAADDYYTELEKAFMELYEGVAELEAENDRRADKIELLREYVVHKRECFKNVALADLGVGGPLASCTCGLDDE